MKFDAGTVLAQGLLINLRYYWYGCRPHPLGKFKIVNFIVNLSKERRLHQSLCNLLRLSECYHKGEGVSTKVRRQECEVAKVKE